jgi:hypothetical protein
MAAVAGKQPIGVKAGMRADTEIGDDTSVFSLADKINAEKFTGAQHTFPRGGNETQLPVAQELVDRVCICEGAATRSSLRRCVCHAGSQISRRSKKWQRSAGVGLEAHLSR